MTAIDNADNNLIIMKKAAVAMITMNVTIMKVTTSGI